MGDSFPRERLHNPQFIPLTAFDSSGRLALGPLRVLVQRLFEAGARVFLPCAGIAEFHSLNMQEIVDVVASVRGAVGKDATIVAPVGMQPEYAMELGERVLNVGADVILIMPFTNPYLSDAGARDYFELLMDRFQSPTVIYKRGDIPSDELLLDMAVHPWLVGVKYANINIDDFHQVVLRDRGRIDWFCGSAERFAPFFAMVGAPGYTTGAGNLCPRITLAMHAAIVRCDWAEAVRIQRILLPIEHYRDRAGSSYSISFLKHAIKRTGLDLGKPRPPYRRLTTKEERKIDAIIEPILDVEAELATSFPQ